MQKSVVFLREYRQWRAGQIVPLDYGVASMFVLRGIARWYVDSGPSMTEPAPPPAVSGLTLHRPVELVNAAGAGIAGHKRKRP